ncbi:hypothetical protein Baya_5956 [Bagarius yarrelli]|uniref:Uncharacterized protein n=1 Tax=Bagarius yarrelli TaxID=175774 RepID=A0A556U0P6_BAGYA|nr:hypothetical protein Baya_5956 [Bagarius yarrelli]
MADANDDHDFFLTVEHTVLLTRLAYREHHLNVPNTWADTLHPEHERKEYSRHRKNSFPPFSGSIRCHVYPLEQRAGAEKNDVYETTVRVPVETKRLPVAMIPRDAEDWISE